MSIPNTATTTSSDAISHNFTEQFREDVHQLLAWGVEASNHEIQSSNEEETNISGFIKEAIQKRIWTSDRPDWCKWYFVTDDTHVPLKGRAGRSRPRADIIILSNQARAEYIFEAKRLRKNGYPVSGYTGDEGMGCFISGQYASKYNEVGMIGYVQSDSVAIWKEKIRKKIDKTNKLQLIPPQSDVKIIDEFPLEWVSNHKRDSLESPIAIYHILLDCCVNV
jgi:hypothetical protein